MMRTLPLPQNSRTCAMRSNHRLAVGASLGRRTCAEAGRKHLRDDEMARTAIGWSGGSAHRLFDVHVDVDRRERLLAEFAQDVEGAAPRATLSTSRKRL